MPPESIAERARATSVGQHLAQSRAQLRLRHNKPKCTRENGRNSTQNAPASSELERPQERGPNYRVHRERGRLTCLPLSRVRCASSDWTTPAFIADWMSVIDRPRVSWVIVHEHRVIRMRPRMGVAVKVAPRLRGRRCGDAKHDDDRRCRGENFRHSESPLTKK